MFKKSQKRQPAGKTGHLSRHLSDKKRRLLEDPKSWHQLFFEEITSRIEEQPYAVLYSKTGHPNAPIRLLIAMLILKEGLNWTDEQLYNECRFNLQVMWALGLSSLDRDVPVESTYYDFKARMSAHMEQTGSDLLGQTFGQLTGQQIQRYKVSGRELRMDSKLFNSNIARCTRLQLVIGVLQKFYREHEDNEEVMSKLAATDRDQLQGLSSRSASNHTHSLDSNQQAELLEQLGALLLRIQHSFDDDDPSTGLIRRLFTEQYDSAGRPEQVRPKNKEAIDSTTLQSPHDTQATFRRKESGQKTQIVQGYSSNITETCAEAEEDQSPCLNLITHVQTEAASISDDAFFRPAVEQSERLSQQTAQAVWTDGAYNSQPNADFADQHIPQALQWYLSHLQGPPSNFEFEFNEDQQLLVTDQRTGQTQMACQSPSKKWRIKDAPHTKNKWRYLDPHLIRNYFRRKQIQQQPAHIRNRRANVESTIRHVFYTLNGNKTKYRGKAPNHYFVLCRCFWVNFRRIWAFVSLFRCQLLHFWPVKPHNSITRTLRRMQLENLLSHTMYTGLLPSAKFYSVVSKNLFYL